VGSSTYIPSVAGGSTVFDIGGQTLAAGSTIVIGSGPAATTVALQSAAGGSTIVVVNGQTSTLSNAGLFPGPTPFTVGGAGITPSVGSGGSTVLNVGETTVGLGSTVTIGSGSSATTIVYQVSGGQTVVVVNGQTTTLPSATTTQGVGGAIISGLGGTGGSGTVSLFTGDAQRRIPSWTMGLLGPMLPCVSLLLLWA
jgi:hypothetical protein